MALPVFCPQFESECKIGSHLSNLIVTRSFSGVREGPKVCLDAGHLVSSLETWPNVGSYPSCGSDGFHRVESTRAMLLCSDCEFVFEEDWLDLIGRGHLSRRP